MWATTVHVPGERVSELLSLDLHVQAYGNQDFRLRCILVDHGWIVVVKTGQDQHSVGLRSPMAASD